MQYFDTCVVVAYYVQEKKSRRVNELFTRADGVAVSPLTKVEFCSAIGRLTQMKTISREDGLKVLYLFDLHLKDNMYTIYPATNKTYELAYEFISALNAPLRALDALHLAVVFSNNLTLVTDDAAFAKTAEQFGVPVERV